MAAEEWKDVPLEHEVWKDVDDSKLNHAGERPWYSVTPEGLARGAIDSIPAIGQVGGGALGGIPGAALGYSGGKELADILRNRLLGDAPTSVDPAEQAKRVVGNLAQGSAQEMGARIIPAAGGKIKDVIDDAATAPLGPAAERVVAEPPGGGSARTSGVRIDPFTKQKTAIPLPPQPDGPGLVTRAMQGVQDLGAKGNELLDKVAPGPFGKAARYLGSKGGQGLIDAAEYGPKAVQSVAGKTSSGLDRASEFLMKSPQFQSLAKNSPKGFSALAAKLNGGGDSSQNEEKAKQAYVQGN